ncbi:MAG: carbohydrate ABC transporter permease, partial [Bacilli bacterium]|nr:carbohydrate ABC transporter permease [Bacilli bacterium]
MKKNHVSIERLPLRPRGKSANARFGKLDIVLFIILLVYAIIIIFPFYNAFLISISPEYVYNETPLLLWPRDLTIASYTSVFQNENLWSGFRITMVLLVLGTAYQMFFTIITGYALSRSNWFGKNFLMNMILVTMFFGGGLIPYYYLITSLNLHDKIWVMIIPGAIDTFNMLLMRNYFQSLPKELEESARIDGANDIQIFVKVYLPLALPMIATVGLFFAVGNWNSWYNAMLFIKTPSLWPLQFVLRNLII